MGFPETFKALSDPVRRDILVMLKRGKMSAGEIGQHFDMTGATISYHLSQLKKAGLIFETNIKIIFIMRSTCPSSKKSCCGFHNLTGGNKMRKKNSSMLVLTTLICLLPIILSMTLYSQLPEQVAVHWDAAGNPDNYVPKAVAAFMLPLITAVINVIVNVGLNNDPKKMNAAPVLRTMGLWLVPALSLILMPITLFKAMGAELPIQTIAPALVGMLLVITGNYLPKSKQNYTVGIKLPWTLNSQDNWNKTHRFAGYLWMAGGAFMILTAFLKVNLAIAIVPVIILIAAAPAIYSFSLFKKGV
ncbi:Immunity protein sdpI [Actinobacillus pleuropneumoniae]|nr:Immunity protein sdpI [Actinobacillus pleuropneumoniae]